MKTSDFLDLVCKALRRTAGSLSLDDTPETVAEWDSVGHLAIIDTLDSALGVDVEDRDLHAFTSLRQLVTSLKARGALKD